MLANFAPDSSVHFSDLREYAATDDTCLEDCVADSVCTGYSTNDDVCRHYRLIGEHSEVVTGVYARVTPARVQTIYSIRRRTPSAGWSIQLYIEGASLLSPIAVKTAGFYSFEPDSLLVPLTLIPSSPLIQLQFIVSARALKEIHISNDNLNGVYAGVGIFLAVCVVGGLLLALHLHTKRAYVHLG
jgi:hypothetical protein